MPEIWQGRTCTVEDGLVMMSAVDDPNNWDFFPGSPFAEQAVALSLPGPFPGYAGVASVEIVDADTLRLIGEDCSRWLLIGNPADGGRIVREDAEYLKRVPFEVDLDEMVTELSPEPDVVVSADQEIASPRGE